MNCPKCNHNQIQESKFNQMNGYKAYRCKQCNHLFEKKNCINSIIDFSGTTLITGNSQTGKTIIAKKIISTINYNRNIIITSENNYLQWEKLFMSNNQVIKAFSVIDLVGFETKIIPRLNLSEDKNYIIKLSKNNANNIEQSQLLNLFHKLIQKDENTTFQTNIIFDDTTLLGIDKNHYYFYDIYFHECRKRKINNILIGETKYTSLHTTKKEADQFIKEIDHFIMGTTNCPTNLPFEQNYNDISCLNPYDFIYRHRSNQTIKAINKDSL